MWVGEYYSNKPSTKPPTGLVVMYGGIHNMWVGEYYSNKPSTKPQLLVVHVWRDT